MAERGASVAATVRLAHAWTAAARMCSWRGSSALSETADRVLTDALELIGEVDDVVASLQPGLITVLTDQVQETSGGHDRWEESPRRQRPHRYR